MDKEKISKLPELPGVYLLKNKEGKIIYIGKAKVLKNRLKTYFQKNNKDLKTQIMSEQIHDFDFFITKNEMEAFLLENTLIKQYKPKYNILLKDDKSFPYIKITIKDPYPGIYLVRESKSKNSIYFGPYFAGEAKKFLEIIFKIFKIRQCRLDLKKPLKRPCIYYDTGMCAAPCVRFISDTAYQEIVNDVIKFLRGDYKSVLDKLKEKMNKYSDNQEYERAAKVRDYIKVIENIMNEQKVVLSDEKDIDVISYIFENNNYYLCILKIRKGRLLNKEVIVFKDIEKKDDFFDNFLVQYYERNIDLPEEILLPKEGKSENLIKIFKEDKVKIIFKKNDHLFDIALKNIEERIKLEKAKEEKNEIFKNQVFILKDNLKLKKIPVVIDGIDISHFAGKNTVGSCVVFKNGVPEKKLYRIYKIKNEKTLDDYAAIGEVIRRRYLKLKQQNSLPDLILIDGGIGQVNVAKEELKKLGLEEIEILGLAKKEEKVFRPYKQEPENIEKEALLLLQRIRDEAHRFALFHQTKLTNKNFKKVIFDNIPFIGEKTKYRIYSEFENIEEFIKALKEKNEKVSFLSMKQKDILLKILQNENKK